MKYGKINVHGIDIFYREAGSPDKPTLILFLSLIHIFPCQTRHIT